MSHRILESLTIWRSWNNKSNNWRGLDNFSTCVERRRHTFKTVIISIIQELDIMKNKLGSWNRSYWIYLHWLEEEISSFYRMNRKMLLRRLNKKLSTMLGLKSVQNNSLSSMRSIKALSKPPSRVMSNIMNNWNYTILHSSTSSRSKSKNSKCSWRLVSIRLWLPIYS